MNARRPFNGEALRGLRESRGMTIEDVYRKLRIPQHVIRALESGRLDDLPEMTYALGFLRTYCEFLDVDPVPFADRLNECARIASAGLLRRGVVIGRKKTTWIVEALTWAAVSAMFALGWLTYALVLQPEPRNTDDGVQAGVMDTAAPVPEATP